MPQISVIVPVYNVEPYLRRCVDSILAQTFADFDLILVDDGSTDGSGAICDEYAQKDSRVRVIHREHSGVSAARNAGLDWAFANSDSQRLSFVDSDDWVHPQYLELLYRAAETDHTKLSACELTEVSGDDAASLTFAPYHDNERRVVDWEQMLVEHHWHAIVPTIKLYARELFQELRYPVGKIHEDEFLTYKLLMRAGNISYLPAVLYYYYRHTQSITKSRFSLRRLDALDALEERIEYVKRTHKKEAIGYSVRYYLECCRDDVEELRTAEHFPLEVRQQKEREIKQRARGVIFRYGLRYAPPWKYGYLYESFFPCLHGIGKAVLKPILKKLKIVMRRSLFDSRRVL